MRASAMIQKFGDNSRNYEQALQRAEREVAQSANEELRLRSSMTKGLAQLAQLHLTDAQWAPDEVQSQLEMRVTDEQVLREHLGAIELKIAAEISRGDALRQQVEHLTGEAARLFDQNPEVQQLLVREQALQADGEGAAGPLREECLSKLKVYDGHAIYRYLVNAGYGTESYRAGRVVRYFDGLVAGWCNFARNRENEQVLLAMLGDLDRRAAAYQEAIGQVQVALKACRVQADRHSGLESASMLLQQSDGILRQLKKEANDAHGSLEAFANCTDGRYQKAMQLMQEALGKADPAELLARAVATEDTRDDDIVRELQALEARLNTLRAKQQALQEQRDAASEDYQRAKRLERNLRSNGRLTSSDYEYRDLDVGSLLAGYMAGRLQDDAVLDAVRSHRREVETYQSPSYRSSSPSNNDSDSGSLFSSGGSQSSGDFFSSSDTTGGGTFSTTDSF